MRTAIRNAALNPVQAHPGLWLERIAPEPTQPGAGLDANAKEKLLEQVTSIAVPDFYDRTFARWRDAIHTSCLTCEVELTSRLIVGHGEPSPLEVGIGLHPTYGVPYIPGSALKGVLSHYVHHYRGSADDRWKGPSFRAKDGTIARLGNGVPAVAPGEWYRTVFGAPAIRAQPGSDWKGYIHFEDALLVPQEQPPLARDIVTPHQRRYYNSHGETSPVDWDEPNPVGLLSVRPKVRFLLALGFERGAEAWAQLAFADLIRALAEQGVGAKTSAGYGRFRQVGRIQPPAGALAIADDEVAAAPETPLEVLALEAEVERVKQAHGITLEVFDAIDFVTLIVAVPMAHRSRARQAVDYLLRHPKLKKKREEKLGELFAALTGTDAE